MSDPDAGFGRFLIEYQFGNDRYSFVLPARSWAEAEERLKRIGILGRVVGSDVVTVPGSLGWLARLLTWWRNLRRPT